MYEFWGNIVRRSIQIKDIQRTTVPNCHGIFSTLFSSDGSVLLSATGKGTIEVIY